MKTSINLLKESNKVFASNNASELKKHIGGQKPKIAVLTCSDSRVIPEFIFNKKIGEIFVVRVAGNVAIDTSVITSLEYAVEHLNIDILMILGHTDCGAIRAAEENKEDCGEFLDEIKKSFNIDPNHVLCNLKRQFELLPMRSKIISKAVSEKKIKLVAAIYNLETGLVEFL
jgi:carbonic anhydrase